MRVDTVCHHTESAAWEEIRARLRERDDESAEREEPVDASEPEPPADPDERPETPTPPADD